MELPEDLQLNIVARLPLKHAVRCKLLSKQHNLVISSLRFWYLRQLFALDRTYLISCHLENGILCAFCPKTGEKLSFTAPSSFERGEIPMCVMASEKGLLCIWVDDATLFVWNPVTGWWRKMPAPVGRNVDARVAGMIVENNGNGTSSFKVFKVVLGQNILYVLDSSDWTWTSVNVGNVVSYAAGFRLRDNQLLAYFLNFRDEPPRLCMFHFASNQLTESTLDSDIFPFRLIVNESSSGRTRAILLEVAEDGSKEGESTSIMDCEWVVNVWEAEEEDVVGSWTPWKVVSRLPYFSHVIGQSEDGKILYVGCPEHLRLYDMESYERVMQSDINGLISERTSIWTPGTFMCTQMKECFPSFQKSLHCDTQEEDQREKLSIPSKQ